MVTKQYTSCTAVKCVVVPDARVAGNRTPASMLRAAAALLLLTCDPVTTYNVVPRRGAILGAAAAAGLPLAPAFAGGKASVNPNKPDGVGANAGAYLKEQEKLKYAEMAGDKGSRGVASDEFEKNDTVDKNRAQCTNTKEQKNCGGLAYDENGRKAKSSTRARTPEEMGLKQWGG